MLPRRRFGLALGGAILVSTVLLGYLLYRTGGVGRTLSLSRGASGKWLAFSAGLYLLSNTCRAWRWRVLLPAGPGSGRRLYAISSVHTMVNILLPARLGELAFPVLMHTHAATTAQRSLTMVFVARALDAVLLGLLFLGGALVHFRSTLSAWTMALTAGALMTGVILVVRSRAVLSWALRHWEQRFPRRTRLAALGRRVEADLLVMTAAHKLAAAAALTAALVLARYVFFWATLQSIGVSLGLAAVAFGATFGEATYLLPLHGVAGLGTVEAGWTLGMSMVGLPLSDAVASGLFVHVWSIVLATATGILCLPFLGSSGVRGSAG